MEKWVQSWRPRTIAFWRFFQSICLGLQNATSLRKSAPGPLNSSDEHVFCTAPAMENASLQILFKCPTPAIVFGNATKPSPFLPTFDKVHDPLRLPRETTSERLKVARTCGALHILTSKCASRHNGVHFFDISTSKSGPELRCFVHFDLEMCFTPQLRALFRHLNFQKWSGAVVFCTFWLGNVLRTTTACNSSYHLASCLRTRRFSESTFRPSGATNHWKNTVFRDFPIYLFAHLHLVSSDSFSSLIFPLLLFSFLLLHLCFSSVHIVGSLTSKHPSISVYIYILCMYARLNRHTANNYWWRYQPDSWKVVPQWTSFSWYKPWRAFKIRTVDTC